MKTTVVTGASTGIGHAVALRQARKGDRVWSLVRSLERSADLIETAQKEGLALTLLEADVTDPVATEAAFAQIHSESGHVDRLVNNAGMFLGSTLEATSFDELVAMTEVNFLGAMRCIKEVLPRMRAAGSGVIACVTSQSTQAIFPTWTAYAGSKCALEGAMEALAMETADLGIRVVLVQPGITLTAMRGKIEPRENPAAYERMLKRYRTIIAADRTESMAPDDVAREIEKALDDDATPFRIRVGVDARRNIALRASVSDEEWTRLFGVEDDEDFYATWIRLAGVPDPRTLVEG